MDSDDNFLGIRFAAAPASAEDPVKALEEIAGRLLDAPLILKPAIAEEFLNGALKALQELDARIRQLEGR